jgi:hypothetical protein
MLRLASLCACALLTSGCVRGLIYTHATRPLTRNFDRTPVVEGSAAEGNVKELRYNGYLRIVWDDNAIGSLAQRAGFSQVYYADLETFSILGIWTQYSVRVYGEKGGAEP